MRFKDRIAMTLKQTTIDDSDGTIPDNAQNMPLMHPQSKSSGIVEEKYMVIVTRYPNGQCYPKIFPLGHRTLDRKPKIREKKDMGQSELMETMEY